MPNEDEDDNDKTPLQAIMPTPPRDQRVTQAHEEIGKEQQDEITDVHAMVTLMRAEVVNLNKRMSALEDRYAVDFQHFESRALRKEETALEARRIANHAVEYGRLTRDIADHALTLAKKKGG